MLADVDTLSDGEVDQANFLPAQQANPVPAQQAAQQVVVHVASHGEKRKQSDAIALSELRQKLRQVVASHCRCFAKCKPQMRRNCFRPFRDPTIFAQIFNLRKTLLTMHKADADRLATCIISVSGLPANFSGFSHG